MWAGSVPASRREATVRLQIAPAEAAQVDFGAGPVLVDPPRGELRRTWAFVKTLCFSRYQYVEFVFDKSVTTGWLVTAGPLSGLVLFQLG
jgi:hypothetical protein